MATRRIFYCSAGEEVTNSGMSELLQIAEILNLEKLGPAISKTSISFGRDVRGRAFRMMRRHKSYCLSERGRQNLC